MKKCLLFVVLLALIQVNKSSAQQLFSVLDTACVRQKIHITNNTRGASSYYWNFCSGYLGNIPTGNNLGADTNFNVPTDVQIAKDGDNYYGFVSNTGKNEILRLSYGTSLSNNPTIENLGSINGTVPYNTHALYVIRDEGSWYLFASGGTDETNSSIARFDFGTSLANTPNGVNFGNDQGILHDPRGIFVAKDGVLWFGFVVNHERNELVRVTLGTISSNTPALSNLGNVGMLNGPSDIAPVLTDNKRWYLLITNQNDNTLTRVAFDFSLQNAPQLYTLNMGVINGVMNQPTAISVVKDCAYYYAFVANKNNNSIARIDIPNIDGGFNGFFTGNYLGNIGGQNSPVGMSRVIRDMDSLYLYTINSGNNSLSRLKFGTCNNAHLPSSTLEDPEDFYYDSPGTYTIFLAVDEGLPTMKTECHTIFVLPVPPIALQPKDTTICEGDIIRLYAYSSGASKYTWSPFYHLSDSLGINVFAWPDYSRDYRVLISFSSGCAIDTFLHVNVVKVSADAGPDRVVTDGSHTVLGGPNTSTGNGFNYTWTPGVYLDNPTTGNPTSTPFADITYYLEVVELNSGLGCKARDTVVVRTNCAEVVLPNAFSPESPNPQVNHFGLLNRQIVQLNYFSIYDRWGREVFTTTDPAKQWDGKINGEPAPFGVYVWQVDGFCVKGQRLTKAGNVTLLR